jgi:hypothetical protein
MKRSESRRKGAPPVLKSGFKWPCVTLHEPPSLEPSSLLFGKPAMAVDGILAAIDAVMPASDVSPVTGSALLTCGTNGVLAMTPKATTEASCVSSLQASGVQMQSSSLAAEVTLKASTEASCPVATLPNGVQRASNGAGAGTPAVAHPGDLRGCGSGRGGSTFAGQSRVTGTAAGGVLLGVSNRARNAGDADLNAAELVAAVAPKVSMSIEPSAQGQPAPGRVHIMKHAAKELPTLLGQEPMRPLCILVTSSAEGSAEDSVLHESLHTAAQQHVELLCCECDVSASQSNDRFGSRVHALPPALAIVSSRGLRLVPLRNREEPSQLVALAMARAAMRVKGASEEAATSAVSATHAPHGQSWTASCDRWSAHGLASDAPHGGDTDKRSAGRCKPSRFDPPSKHAKAGVTRMFPGKGEAVYWPGMPCLRCGCPWWNGEDWDAKCVRCGWSCESEGYDDDSEPLKQGPWQEKYETFTAFLREGRTAPWPPQ